MVWNEVEGKKLRKLENWSMKSKTQINSSYIKKTNQKRKRKNEKGKDINKEKIQENVNSQILNAHFEMGY